MTTYKCPHCGGEISPAQLLGQSKKTMSPAAVAARSANGKKGGWPKGKPRKPIIEDLPPE